jgi:hypothetical protein
MTLPGFTAEIGLYHAARPYRHVATAGQHSIGLTPQAAWIAYDCAGKDPNTKYIHPSDCTKYVQCFPSYPNNGYEQDCADCQVNPDNCPTGRTHFDFPTQACLWSYEAGCVSLNSFP